MSAREIELLKERYSSFINSDDNWDFFLGVANYVKFILENKNIDKITDDKFIARQAELQKEYSEYESRTVEEIRSSYKKILDIIEKNVPKEELADGPQIKETIKTFNDFNEGRAFSSEALPNVLERHLFDVVRTVNEVRKERLQGELSILQVKMELATKQGKNSPATVKRIEELKGKIVNRDELFADFLTSNPQFQNIYGNYLFSNTLESTMAFRKKVEALQKIEPWGDWNKLCDVYNAVYKADEILGKFKKEDKSYMATLGFGFLLREIEEMKGRKPWEQKHKLVHFIIGNYKGHVSRVHMALIEELSKQETEPESKPIHVDKSKWPKNRRLIDNLLHGNPQTKAMSIMMLELKLDKIDQLEWPSTETNNAETKTDDNFFTEKSRKEAIFFIEITGEGRVILNGTYLLSKPVFGGENHQFINFCLKYGDRFQIITSKKVEGFDFKRPPHEMLSDLNFGTEIKKIFFPESTKSGIKFRNYLSQEEINELPIQKKKLNSEIKSLRKLSGKELETMRKGWY